MLKLLVSLSEQYLVSTTAIEVEEVSLIEHCLSISLTLLLRNPELMDKVVLKHDCKFLSENSPLRLEDKSDFISYFMAGLLTTRSSYFSDFFNHGFVVFMRESKSQPIQKMLL